MAEEIFYAIRRMQNENGNVYEKWFHGDDRWFGWNGRTMFVRRANALAMLWNYRAKMMEGLTLVRIRRVVKKGQKHL